MRKGNYRKNMQSGQGLTEYAVVLSLVAVASIACMALFGGAIKGRIASLSAAVAGQSESDVTAADKKAKEAAKEATRKASSVRGNITVDKDNVFDEKSF